MMLFRVVYLNIQILYLKISNLETFQRPKSKLKKSKYVRKTNIWNDLLYIVLKLVSF